MPIINRKIPELFKVIIDWDNRKPVTPNVIQVEDIPRWKAAFEKCRTRRHELTHAAQQYVAKQRGDN